MLRSTFTGTLVPGLVATTILTSSSLLPTGRPLYWTITSPGSTPAFSAAPPGVTSATIAPMRLVSPKSSNPSRGTASTETPMRPRITLPVCSCGSRSRTVLLGTANPIPMFPSLRALVMMAVFMPMTSPRTLSSGPPELPGLIAASVCSMSFERPLVTRNARDVALITPTVTVCS